MSGPRVSSLGCHGSLMNEPEVLVPKIRSIGFESDCAVRATAAQPPVRIQKRMSAMTKTARETMRTRLIIGSLYLHPTRSFLVRAQDAKRFAQPLVGALDLLWDFAQCVAGFPLRVAECFHRFERLLIAMQRCGRALS